MGSSCMAKGGLAKPSDISPHPLPGITGFPVTRLKVRVSFQPCQASAGKNQADVNIGERETAP